MNRPSNILVIRLSAMGDVAMTVPVLQVFSHTYPEVALTVLSRPFFRPLFRHLPNMQFLEADVNGKHKRLGLLKLAKEARTIGIDAVADLHGVIRSKVISGYLKTKNIPIATIDKGRAEKKALTSTSSKNLKALKSTHNRYAEVFANLGYPLDLQDFNPLPQEELPPKLKGLIGVEDKTLIGIAPFAAHDGKMYPLQMMEQVLTLLDTSNKYRVFLFGGGKEEIKQLTKLENPFTNVTSVAGKLNFEEELALISILDLMLSMDSGNGHLAAIYGVPTMTLWGVTHPYAGFAPFGQPRSHQILADRQKFPLIPTSIYGNKFPKGYEDAMKTIEPRTVFLKIKEILSKKSVG